MTSDNSRNGIIVLPRLDLLVEPRDVGLVGCPSQSAPLNAAGLWPVDLEREDLGHTVLG